jgi:hypothetical protein
MKTNAFCVFGGILFLCLISCAKNSQPSSEHHRAVFSVSHVNEVGNGGSNEEGEFVTVIQTVLDHQMGMHPDKRILTEAQVNEMRSILNDRTKTRIEFTTDELKDDQGKPVGASNRSVKGRIDVKVNRIWWREDLLAGFDVYRLALHEVLPAIGVDDKGFKFSWRLAMAGYRTGDGLWVRTITINQKKYTIRFALNLTKESKATSVVVVDGPGNCTIRPNFPARYQLLVQTENGEVVLGKGGTIDGSSMLQRSFRQPCDDHESALEVSLRRYATSSAEEVYYELNEHVQFGEHSHYINLRALVSGGVIVKDGIYSLMGPQPGQIFWGSRKSYSEILSDPGNQANLASYDSAYLFFWTQNDVNYSEVNAYSGGASFLKLSTNQGDFLQVRRKSFYQPAGSNDQGFAVNGEYEFSFFEPEIKPASRVFLVTSWKTQDPNRWGEVKQADTDLNETEMWPAGGHRWMVNLLKVHRAFAFDLSPDILATVPLYQRYALQEVALSVFVKIMSQTGEVTYQRGNYSRNGRYDIPLGLFANDFKEPSWTNGIRPGFVTLPVYLEAID